VYAFLVGLLFDLMLRTAKHKELHHQPMESNLPQNLKQRMPQVVLHQLRSRHSLLVGILRLTREHDGSIHLHLLVKHHRAIAALSLHIAHVLLAHRRVHSLWVLLHHSYHRSRSVFLLLLWLHDLDWNWILPSAPSAGPSTAESHRRSRST
jgi:hypothetical protein